LASYCNKTADPYIVGGDFNIVRFSFEKNQNFSQNRFSDVFNAIINACDLREIYISGGSYTWSNNHVSPTLEKLDRILMSKDWEVLFPSVCVYKHPREMSDHNPLILTSGGNYSQHNRAFRLELTWLKHEEFMHIVKSI
jgi:endonuclease/exonuclease/phosphatase family metal-dependent hydrolase